MRPAPDGKRCLELGSGGGPRPLGWLTTELEPAEGALKLDASQPFPIADQTFDYAYSRHMIEHLSFAAGRFMPRERFRILKPGGTIRIVTPSIGFPLELFASEKSPHFERYIEWATETFVPDAPKPMPSFVFNNFVRAWGHTFIYDRTTLELILIEAGFAAIRKRDIGKSDHPNPRNLEAEDRMPAGFLALESMILEATRPLSG